MCFPKPNENMEDKFMAFTKFDLERTKHYADEVVQLIREVEKDMKEVDALNVPKDDDGYDHFHSYNGVLRAELRRRSMDLTRALADLRR